MMKLSLQTFATIVANSATAVQAATNQLLDLSTGSVLRAILEANASIALWMQWLIVRVLRATRASTSSAEDLDSWMADFGFARLPPTSAVGIVTFSRYNTDVAVPVPPGSLVKTNDGTQIYQVYSDPSSAVWDTSSGAYVMKIGISGIDVPVIAQLPGASGNVQAGSITLISSSLPGVDTVSNAIGTYSGTDAEPDPAFRLRFNQFINSRSRATLIAIGCAITSVQQGLSYLVKENIDGSGSPRSGGFLIIVDDGSGSPSPTVLSAVYAAVDAVRPIGSLFTVKAPAILSVDLFVCITLKAGADQGPIISAVRQTITSFVNRLPIGAGLPLTRIAQLAYDTDSNVVNVSGLLLNGGTVDIIPDSFSVIKMSNLMVTAQ
jgi:uncharacterized phage protein gp47/JayE